MRSTLAEAAFLAGCTVREVQVLCLVGEDGLPYPEIAERLSCTLHAVECHASNARRKLRVEVDRRADEEALAEAISELRQRTMRQVSCAIG